MIKVLVTGVTGKSGLYFYNELKNNASKLSDYQFDFIVRNEQKAKEKLDCRTLNQNLKIGSLEDKLFINSVLFGGGYSVLLHIAGIGRSLDLVDTAVKYGVKRLILVHTTGIYSKYKAAGEAYRVIESKIEKIIENRDVKLTYLRPTMIYGNINDHNVAIFMKMVDKLRIFPVVDGAKYELQPVWCGDLGKAYYKVLMSPETAVKRNYNLSGGKPILLIDMFKVMAQYLGVKNKFISVPFWLAYSLAWIAYLLSFSTFDYREKVQRLVEPRTFEYTDAANDFGYSPLSFEDGIKMEIDEYIEKYRTNK